MERGYRPPRHPSYYPPPPPQPTNGGFPTTLFIALAVLAFCGFALTNEPFLIGLVKMFNPKWDDLEDTAQKEQLGFYRTLLQIVLVIALGVLLFEAWQRRRRKV